MRSINHSNVFHVSHITLDEQLKKFWELEVPKIKHWRKEEMCEQHFQQNFKVEHNRFVVGLPFKDEVVLGDSFDQAKRRFNYLQRRLSQKPDLKKKYSEFIEEFKNMDHIEVPAAQEITPTGQSYYLPHHCVFKEDSTTTKLRVVFDGPAKTTNGMSINDAMMVVPVVQDDLYSIIMRFRFYPIALSADIAKTKIEIFIDFCGLMTTVI